MIHQNCQLLKAGKLDGQSNYTELNWYYMYFLSPITRYPIDEKNQAAKFLFFKFEKNILPLIQDSAQLYSNE